jgi:hypothetical protein
MDTATVAATAAVLGSLAGASASVVTTWIAQRMQITRANLEWQLRERESLYSEFLSEASRLAVDATLHSLDRPDQLVAIYGLLSRIRLISSDAVLKEAEGCVLRIVDLYRRPNMTAGQFREALEASELDPLKEFSAACRKELLTPPLAAWLRAVR